MISDYFTLSSDDMQITVRTLLSFLHSSLNALYISIPCLRRIINFFCWSSNFCRYLDMTSFYEPFFCTTDFCYFFCLDNNTFHFTLLYCYSFARPLYLYLCLVPMSLLLVHIEGSRWLFCLFCIHFPSYQHIIAVWCRTIRHIVRFSLPFIDLHISCHVMFD